ncbi:Chromatin assembly complex, subunit 3 [Castilleja foliolosa]|uniref:Chromatin assembly complex, subunit 3 n=1 Tax=Castilleja foliolosa TaxID=1961234 RepID=A0ABD3CZ35_9LAMI
MENDGDQNEMTGETEDFIEEFTEEFPEEFLVNEEYKIWTNNTPFMYDLIISQALNWPSLTVEWLPDREEPLGKGYSVQKMILGTD